MGGVGGKKSCGHSLKHRKSMQHNFKVLENTYTKHRRLKIETATNMDDCFTICQICQYKTQEPTNTEISAPISLEV